MRKSFWHKLFSLPIIALSLYAVAVIGIGAASVVVRSPACQWCGSVGFDFPWWKQVLTDSGVPWNEVFQFTLAFPVVVSVIVYVIAQLRSHRQAVDELSDTHTPSAERLARHRQFLIDTVQNNWIDGVFDRSLYRSVLLELGKEVAPNSVIRPWDVVVQSVDGSWYVASHETKIMEVFRKANYWLLILGVPGGGKTTTLLEMAKELLDRCRSDATQPVPVVLRLSSWDDINRTLETWLITELESKYRIPQDVGTKWIEENALTLLLDGLDEAQTSAQKSLVQRINEFCRQRSVGIVVSTRETDYNAIGEKLLAGGAVKLLPLNQEQISTYVADLGTNGQILAELLTREPKLVELAQTPLFLNIMALAAPEVIQQLSTGDTTTEDLREQVIDAFIRQMLMRSKAIRTHSSSEKTIRYLQFLGQNMQRLNISAIIPNWVSIFKFGDESYENFISTFRGLSLAYVLVSLLGLFTFFVMQNYPWPPVQNVALGTTTLLVLLMSIYYFVVPRVIRQRYKSEQFEVIRTQLLRTAQGKTVLVVSIVMAVAYTLMTYWSFTRLSYSVRAVVIIALPVYLFV